ncbi:hypothetical protein KJ761_01770 [Patescibacteria group bacterium]|nr:hypothetical protein [Patescibacteria group bacterium]
MLNKSILNVKTREHGNASASNQPANELPVQNIPVHSMKKDLEIIANPALLRQQETAPLPVSPSPQPATSTPRISPFLEKTDLPSTVPVSQKKPANLAIPSVKKQPLKPAISDSSSEFDLKKVFVFSTIFLSVIALGIGSYYFWLVRGNDSESPIEEPTTPASLPIEEPVLPAATIEPEIEIEQPKENTLVLDLASFSPAEIKTEIKNQIEKLPKDSFAQPVEFKLKDPQNNLLNFSLFAEKSGLAFAQNLSAYLGESFSLLVFSDGPNLGTGLIIESKNDALLTQALLEKEATLPKDLDAIFLTAAPEETKKVSFSNYTYKDLPLRYFNLISPEKLTIDYAVTKNRLIIGTTKNTFFAFYDWFLLQSAAQ